MKRYDRICAVDGTASAYDCLAPYYDEFTRGYAHDEWIARIEQRASQLGLRGNTALDVACGTGKSTAPLISRGYEVVACDISPAMVQMAKASLPAQADSFLVADMRELPPLGRFDFVLCLDDALNYLITEKELEQTFAGIARALSPNGVLAFDVNSWAAYRSSFAQAMIRESSGLYFTWRGDGSLSGAGAA